MAKISQLPVLAAPNGTELVPAVRGGVTHGARFVDLAKPSLDQAALAAEAASIFVGGVLFPSIEAGLADTAAGRYFLVAGVGSAFAVLYRKLDGVAVEQGRYNSRAAFAAAGGAALVGYGAKPLDDSLVKSLSWFGVDRFTILDQWQALRNAFDAASAEGLLLRGHPEADYRHDGPLNLSGGASFEGQGATLIALSDGPQAVIATGTGWRLTDFATRGAATSRDPGFDDRNGVYVNQAADFTIARVVVGSVDEAARRGHGLAGMLFRKSSRGAVNDCIVRLPFADGYHVTDGCEDLTFARTIAVGTGDDSHAVVGYRSQNTIPKRITFTDSLSINGGSRGIAFVGAVACRASRPRVIGSAAAAAYIFSEASFDTYGNYACTIDDLYAYGCVAGAAHLGANFQNAAVMIGGRGGSDQVDGELITRASVDCRITGFVHRAGARCSAVVDVSTPDALRPKVDLVVRDMVGTSLAPVGVLLGGVDADVRLRVDNLGGIVGALATGAAGDARLQVDADVTRQQGQGPTGVLYLDNATALRSLSVTGTISNSPADLVTSGSPLPTTKLRLRDIRLNGTRLVDRDFIAAGLSMEGSDYRLFVPRDGGTLNVPQVQLRGGQKLRISVDPRLRCRFELGASGAFDGTKSNYTDLAELWQKEDGSGDANSGNSFVAIPAGGVYQRRQSGWPGTGIRIGGVGAVSIANTWDATAGLAVLEVTTNSNLFVDLAIRIDATRRSNG